MCRMIGVVGRVAARFNGLIGDDLDAFTSLSREHADGWGIAAWRHGSLDLQKEPQAAYLSPSFSHAVDTVATDAAILHIRMANPGSPLILANTHPFHAPSLAFVHNGHFEPASALDDLLDPGLVAQAGGDTDSERFFLLVQQLMRDYRPAVAMARAAAAIRQRASFSGLNCMLLTPTALLAYSEEDPGSGVSLRRGPEYFPLKYLVEPDRVVIASSGWVQQSPPWQRLAERQVLEVSRHDVEVTLHSFGDDDPSDSYQRETVRYGGQRS